MSLLKDPLDVFPTEIWQDILQLASGDDDYYRPAFWEVDLTLLFTLVSTSWRRKILSSPIMWNTIRMLQPAEDLEAKLAMVFHLSANSPLDLHLKMTNDVLNTIDPYITGQGHRIRVLSLDQNITRNHEGSASEVDGFLTNFMSKTGSLTALEDVSFSGLVTMVPNADTILKDAIHVKSLSTLRVSPEILQRDSMRGLQNFRGVQSPDEIVPYISGFTHLRTIWFRGDPEAHDQNPQFQAITGSESDIETKETMLRTDMTSWKVSWLHMDYPYRMGWFFLNHTAENLKHLSILLSWAQLFTFISTSQGLVRLERLQITLPISRHDKFDLPPSSSSPSVQFPSINVKSMELTISSMRFFISRDEEALAICQRNATRLADILILWAPDVEYLRIQGPVEDNFATSYVQSLRNLKGLVVLDKPQGFRSSTTHPSKVLIPLSSINSISIPGKSSLFGLFTYPNARYLSLEGTLASNRYAFRDIIVQESLPNLSVLKIGKRTDNWVNLISLNLADENADWRGISLPKVETITIGHSRRRYSTDRMSSSTLLSELAQNAFPSLQHLNMRCIPEWDLLFIMLERRNCSKNSPTPPELIKSIRPIVTLSLPCLPPPFILRALVSRLRKRLSRRPSNWDISLQSLAEAYFDPSLPGCDFCLLSYLPCNAPTRRISTFRTTTKPLNYPITDDEVLAASSQRVEWWAVAIRAGVKRDEPCERHNCSILTKIEPNTDLGYIEETREDVDM